MRNLNNIYLTQPKEQINTLILANIEALAQIDKNDDNDNADNEDDNTTTWQICPVNETVEIYETTSAGYSWDVEGKFWLLNGKRTETVPPQYTKTTKTISYKCCKPKGDVEVCNYEPC